MHTSQKSQPLAKPIGSSRKLREVVLHPRFGTEAMNSVSSRL